MTLSWGREICSRLTTAETREWLCTNGIGGFASGTAAGLLTRRYHGLLVAALKPPLGRTLLAAKLDETVEYDGLRQALFTNRWADGTVDPHGYRLLERFRLEGTSPVWTFAVADALLERRIWMEQGANTTYVQYRLRRGRGPVRLEAKALVNYRDYHWTAQGGGWMMSGERIPHGLRVTAFPGAQPFCLLAEGAEADPAHEWYHGFDLAAERARGLDARDDHLHITTFRASLQPGSSLTIVLSTEATPALDGEAAWERRCRLSPGHGVGLAAGAVRPGPPPGLQRSRDGAILPRSAGLPSR